MVLPSGLDLVPSKEIIELEVGEIVRFRDCAKEEVIRVTSAQVSKRAVVALLFTSILAFSLSEPEVEME